MTPFVITPDAAQSSVACVNCGYDLRGLDRAGRCPECGSEICLSLRALTLDGSDRGWLAKLIIGGMLQMFVLFLAAASEAFYIFQFFNRFAFTGGTANLLQQLRWGIEIFSVLALFLLTATEPGQAFSARAARLWLRILVVWTLVSGIVFDIIGPFVPFVLRATWGLLLTDSGLVINFLLCDYLAKLSRRLPDESLASNFIVLKWAKTVATLIGPHMFWVVMVFKPQTYIRGNLLTLPGHLLRILFNLALVLVVGAFVVAISRLRADSRSNPLST